MSVLSNEPQTEPVFSNLLGRFRNIASNMRDNAHQFEVIANRIKLNPPEKQDTVSVANEKSVEGAYYEEMLKVLLALEDVLKRNNNTLNKLNSLF